MIRVVSGHSLLKLLDLVLEVILLIKELCLDLRPFLIEEFALVAGHLVIERVPIHGDLVG